MQSFIPSIEWESEVWIADDPAHMIHFNGDKFLDPYPDTMGNSNGFHSAETKEIKASLFLLKYHYRRLKRLALEAAAVILFALGT